MSHVTVPDRTRRVQFSVGGSPSTGPFSFNFSYFASGDIKVYKGTTLLTLTTDYTLTGVAGTDGGYEGGSVTLVVAASNTTITVLSDIPIERVSDFPDAGSFNRGVLNTTFDKHVAMMRELEDRFARALLSPVTDPTSLVMDLPAQASRASKVLAFDSSGQPVASNQTLATLEAGSTAAAASAAAALVSQLAAAAAQAAAEAALDSFDDWFLGVKAADPTLDNDGNALVAGAIYWNSGGNKFRVWTGSAWADAFPSGVIAIGSGGTGATTADAALWALINGATSGATPAMSDKIAYGAVGATAGRFLTFQQFWNTLNSLTAYTALNSADELTIRDGSGGGAGARKMTIANFLLGIGKQGRNIAGRNGGCEVWQRGTSIALAASSPAYTLDGWYLGNGANQAATVSQQAGLTAGSRFCARVQRNSGQTGTGTMLIEYPLDADEAAALSGQIVTLSMTLRSGANWSPTSGNITARLYTGTGAAAKRTSGAYTGEATPIDVTQAITTTATRYTFTSSALGASVTQASIYLTWTPTGTAGAADYFEIDDVQLEVAPFATPFERRPFEAELRACQRHYWKSFPYSTAPAQNVGINTGEIFSIAGVAGASSQRFWLRFPCSMRVSPTMTTYNPAAANALARDESAAADFTSTNVGSTSPDGVQIGGLANAATAVGNLIGVHVTADAGI